VAPAAAVAEGCRQVAPLTLAQVAPPERATGIRQVCGDYHALRTFDLDQCYSVRDENSRQNWHCVAFVTEQDVVTDGVAGH